MYDTKNAIYLNNSTPPHILTLVLLAGMAALSMNIFLPSLPGMTAYFDTTYAIMNLSISMYLAFTALLQLFIGPISDRVGRRPVVLVSFVIFFIATIGCLLSTSIEVFLFFRMLQAFIVTGMVLSRAIVRDIVEDKKAASMIGYVTMGMAMVPMFAPAIGGFLNDLFGWKANFSMLLFIGIIIAALAYFDLGETNNNISKGFSKQFKEYPELFKSKRFWAYSFTTVFASGSFFSFIGGAPFVSTNSFELSSSAFGIYFGVTTLGYVVGSFISGKFSERFGIHFMLLQGSWITALGLLLSLFIFWLGFGSATVFFGCMILAGVGNGMVLPNANAGLLSVRPSLAGSASGIGGAIMLGGGAFLAYLAGLISTEQAGPYPLMYLMIFTAFAALFIVRYIIFLERDIVV
ncbi:MAG: multidrug effflux MFS transporter [Rhodobacteraceae bacterium]|jgi:DHA1 family bicyclomycin/chloramphenicol resistance-like MFS transporter|nr:multidrug effflux MFS transporter [Paracoccaceae bacterium]MDB4229305.1 multidrug effflux MFS transporter [Paracoccaceae bacterium]|tara:strand:- start:5239 stop:6453 length:1215 start_codon:yes stop_codon:yes gene_type:complete